MFQLLGRDERIKIVEWTSIIFGIPWTVWWGFFIDSWLNSEIERITIWGQPVTKEFMMVLSVVVVSLFVALYVRWLWKLASWEGETTLVRFWDDFKELAALLAALSIIIWQIHGVFQLQEGGILYGVSLTVLWAVLPAVQIEF